MNLQTVLIQLHTYPHACRKCMAKTLVKPVPVELIETEGIRVDWYNDSFIAPLNITLTEKIMSMCFLDRQCCSTLWVGRDQNGCSVSSTDFPSCLFPLISTSNGVLNYIKDPTFFIYPSNYLQTAVLGFQNRKIVHPHKHAFKHIL